MTGDKELAFVDTNVLVYGFDKSNSPKKRIAQQLLNTLMHDDRFRLSTQVLQELFVTLTRKVGRPCSTAEALTILDDLSAWPVMTIDYVAIRGAAELANQAKLSFWDALIVMAAVGAGCKILYTEDLNDRQELLGIRISNPFLPSRNIANT